jgi:hypothetical protein
MKFSWLSAPGLSFNHLVSDSSHVWLCGDDTAFCEGQEGVEYFADRPKCPVCEDIKNKQDCDMSSPTISNVLYVERKILL